MISALAPPPHVVTSAGVFPIACINERIISDIHIVICWARIVENTMRDVHPGRWHKYYTRHIRVTGVISILPVATVLYVAYALLFHCWWWWLWWWWWSRLNNTTIGHHVRKSSTPFVRELVPKSNSFACWSCLLIRTATTWKSQMDNLLPTQPHPHRHHHSAGHLVAVTLIDIISFTTHVRVLHYGHMNTNRVIRRNIDDVTCCGCTH